MATEAKSKTTVELEKQYADDPNWFVRVKPYDILRRFLQKPKMTHVEFCDVKAQAWVDLWNRRKSSPLAGRKIKPLTDEQLDRKNAKLLAAEQAIKTLRAEIAASEALKKKK